MWSNSKGNQFYFELVGTSSYRGFKLSGFNCSRKNVQANLWKIKKAKSYLLSCSAVCLSFKRSNVWPPRLTSLFKVCTDNTILQSYLPLQSPYKHCISHAVCLIFELLTGGFYCEKIHCSGWLAAFRSKNCSFCGPLLYWCPVHSWEWSEVSKFNSRFWVRNIFPTFIR